MFHYYWSLIITFRCRQHISTMMLSLSLSLIFIAIINSHYLMPYYIITPRWLFDVSFVISFDWLMPADYWFLFAAYLRFALMPLSPAASAFRRAISFAVCWCWCHYYMPLLFLLLMPLICHYLPDIDAYTLLRLLLTLIDAIYAMMPLLAR